MMMSLLKQNLLAKNDGPLVYDRLELTAELKKFVPHHLLHPFHPDEVVCAHQEKTTGIVHLCADVKVALKLYRNCSMIALDDDHTEENIPDGVSLTMGALILAKPELSSKMLAPEDCVVICATGDVTMHRKVAPMKMLQDISRDPWSQRLFLQIMVENEKADQSTQTDASLEGPTQESLVKEDQDVPTATDEVQDFPPKKRLKVSSPTRESFAGEEDQECPHNERLKVSSPTRESLAGEEDQECPPKKQLKVSSQDQELPGRQKNCVYSIPDKSILFIEGHEAVVRATCEVSVESRKKYTTYLLHKSSGEQLIKCSTTLHIKGRSNHAFGLECRHATSEEKRKFEEEERDALKRSGQSTLTHKDLRDYKKASEVPISKKERAPRVRHSHDDPVFFYDKCGHFWVTTRRWPSKKKEVFAVRGITGDGIDDKESDQIFERSEMNIVNFEFQPPKDAMMTVNTYLNKHFQNKKMFVDFVRDRRSEFLEAALRLESHLVGKGILKTSLASPIEWSFLTDAILECNPASMWNECCRYDFSAELDYLKTVHPRYFRIEEQERL